MDKLNKLEKQVFKEVEDRWDALFIICESSRESRNSHKQYEKNLKEKLKQYKENGYKLLSPDSKTE